MLQLLLGESHKEWTIHISPQNHNKNNQDYYFISFIF